MKVASLEERKKNFYSKINKNFSNGSYTILDEYTNTNTKYRIRHEVCGHIFERWGTSLMSFPNTDNPCPNCRGEVDPKTFYINKLNEKIKGEYLLLEGEFEGIHSKILLKHIKCGHQYLVKFNNIINNNRGCPKCAGNIKKTKEDFQNLLDDKSNPGEYKVIGDYKNKDHPTEVIHNICNRTTKLTYGNVRGNRFGCKHCSMSSGERKVNNILTDLGIDFVYQYQHDDCFDIVNLPMDFYFKFNNKEYIIEYDGRQHWLPIFGNNDKEREENLIKTKEHDEIKNKFCKDNGIEMIRIRDLDKDIIKNKIIKILGI